MSKPAKPFQRCKVCGCSDDRACATALGPCFWIEDNLCSACALEAFNPNPAHALVFETLILNHNPLMHTQLSLVSLMQLLVNKGLITKEEASTAYLQEVREASNPIEHPGTIILPGKR